MCPSESAGALLTTVLDVERELEGRLEVTADACGSFLQHHREFSESSEAYTHTTHKGTVENLF